MGVCVRKMLEPKQLDCPQGCNVSTAGSNLMPYAEIYPAIRMSSSMLFNTHDQKGFQDSTKQASNVMRPL